MTTEPLAIRVAEAADLLHIGRTKAYELIRRGELPSIRIGDSVRVPLKALRQYVESKTVSYGQDS